MHTTPPTTPSETAQVAQWLAAPVMDADSRRRAVTLAESLVAELPAQVSLADELMQTYPLDSKEGIALMSLAEAMLRVPDAETRDALLHDKLPGRHWTVEGGSGRARLTGAAMAALGDALDDGHASAFTTAAARLGMPLIRQAVQQAMKLFGGQFVLAETIDDALQKAATAGDTLFSFDMLGEGARDEHTAARYLNAYETAITRTAAAATSDDTHANNGVSVKLSALYARHETRQRDAVMRLLLPRAQHLATLAKRGNIPLTLDAEEMARLPLSLDITAALMNAPALAGWHGLGVAVQAYGRRAAAVLDTLLTLAQSTKRGIAIRLIKGAYWDTEIKIAQQKGLADFPVFTRKTHTDLAYLHHAHRLLRAPAAVLPQFASHNAATLAAVEIMAAQLGGRPYEVQRLYGMGDALHDNFRRRHSHRLRIYAPVGSHDDLLAYLVRRLLENGANSSFIHRLREGAVPPRELVAHPHDLLQTQTSATDNTATIKTGATLFQPQRDNSRGTDLDCPHTLAALQQARAPFMQKQYLSTGGTPRPSPADPTDLLATPADTPPAAIPDIIKKARAHSDWRQTAPAARADILRRIAALYQQNSAELYALLAREAGKTIDDAIDELREAIDFCHCYAAQLTALDQQHTDITPRGIVAAISPWNFPLAIFTGQITAALAAGNNIIAKPAEQTPLIARLAVQLMHRAGVPPDALQLIHGTGEDTGAALTAAGADMIAFTGSTDTARAIARAIAASPQPAAPLLAETGGINAMIVDSSALPEQAVDDIITSAFQSAGQRCSALRVLYLQDDIADNLLQMLTGAAAQLTIGDPRQLNTDIGPVIDAAAAAAINAHLDAHRDQLIWRAPPPKIAGNYIAPAILRVDSINDIKREVFGPVLHVATFAAGDFTKIMQDINRSGYGLTFGLHSRMETRQRAAAETISAGNLYLNRNQVGAVVGSQPFGGHGLSGTGPKAGGPRYLPAFTRNIALPPATEAQLLPGPDGEENRYQTHPRGHILCLAATQPAAQKLQQIAEQHGNTTEWLPSPAALPNDLSGTQAILAAPDTAPKTIATIRQRIAATDGPLIPLITDQGGHCWLTKEKHISTNTTALGGNVSLLTISG